ncbi:MAG: hypothetical protein HUJ13_04000 [Hydrogenovibrio crunogenus]|uniref:Uncharacterized protein n=1 Tax=Hydrogenovibrio crunogenus TaxID=39765 RepID=A0A4P7NYC1_9GAMM|nr:hypothetical protein [Hydrogenovibrio crunogenus]MBD3611570.1 hypothetical protein [Hydrogenovibrio crunogenus]QBZ82791.1 hypothetical protein GHNINEIG_00827 [Hydrogenovibrio crunogenus]
MLGDFGGNFYDKVISDQKKFKRDLKKAWQDGLEEGRQKRLAREEAEKKKRLIKNGKKRTIMVRSYLITVKLSLNMIIEAGL